MLKSFRTLVSKRIELLKIAPVFNPHLKMTGIIKRNIRSIDATQVYTSTQIENNGKDLNQKNFFGVIDQFCTKVDFCCCSNSLF